MLWLLVALSVLGWSPPSNGAGQIFARSSSFCSLDMTYADLEGVIRRIREFTVKANRDVERKYVRERLSLAGGNTKLEISGDFSERSLSQGPQLAMDVSYSFSHDDAPISGVTLRLGDHSRELTVSGTDRAQVEGLILLASEDIAQLGCSFGGSSRRSLGGLGLMLLAVVLGSIASFPGLRSNTVRIALIVPAIIMYAAVLFFPWEQWLPGTVVRAARVSVLERNAALIGFVGTVAGVVSIVIALSPGVRRLIQRQRGGEAK
jgi:hypothetical protein